MTANVEDLSLIGAPGDLGGRQCPCQRHRRAGSGAASLAGGDGDDWIYGGAGNDRLTGGSGIPPGPAVAARISVFSKATGRDVVHAYEQGIDRLNLAAIDASATAAGDQAFAFVGSAAFSGTASGELRYDGTTLSGDVDGDGRADFEDPDRQSRCPDVGRPRPLATAARRRPSPWDDAAPVPPSGGNRVDHPFEPQCGAEVRISRLSPADRPQELRRLDHLQVVEPQLMPRRRSEGGIRRMRRPAQDRPEPLLAPPAPRSR